MNKKKYLHIFLSILFAIFFGITLETSCNAYTYENYTSGDITRKVVQFNSGDIDLTNFACGLKNNYTLAQCEIIAQNINNYLKTQAIISGDINAHNVLFFRLAWTNENGQKLCFILWNGIEGTSINYPNLYFYGQSATSSTSPIRTDNYQTFFRILESWTTNEYGNITGVTVSNPHYKIINIDNSNNIVGDSTGAYVPIAYKTSSNTNIYPLIRRFKQSRLSCLFGCSVCLLFL